MRHRGVPSIRGGSEPPFLHISESSFVRRDHTGTRAGFDCELTAAVAGAVQIPVIASGGAGSIGHFVDVFGAGRADAALAASIFHFGVHSARELKQSLRDAGIPVRWPC